MTGDKYQIVVFVFVFIGLLLSDEDLAGDWWLVSIQTSTRGSRTSGKAQTKT